MKWIQIKRIIHLVAGTLRCSDKCASTQISGSHTFDSQEAHERGLSLIYVFFALVLYFLGGCWPSRKSLTVTNIFLKVAGYEGVFPYLPD
jgi:hypothetical protein